MPCHERLVVIGAEVVPVFHDIKPGDGLCDANGRGKHPVGEDIFIDPRIGSRLLLAVADGMQQEQPRRFQQPFGRLHENIVIFPSHVLEHPHGDDAIELPFHGTVILQQPVDEMPGIVFPGIGQLFRGNRDPGDLHPVFFGHI